MNFDRLTAILSSVPQLDEQSVAAQLADELAQLTRERATLSLSEDAHARALFREQLLERIHESHFCRYAYEKPRGYPGDFLTQEMIWLSRTNGREYRYIGDTPFGRVINSITMSMDNCAANEERVRFLRRLIRRSSGGRIASIGCGSAIELWDAAAVAGRQDWDFVLVDQDGGALEAARKAVALRESQVRYVQDNVLKFILRAEQRLGERDLVYLFGLLDYFSLPSAHKIVGRLWPTIATGGELVVTNAHPSNTSRLWMEYVADWYLDYKTAPQLLKLAEGLDGCQAEIHTDSLGVYQYLRLKRAETAQTT